MAVSAPVFFCGPFDGINEPIDSRRAAALAPKMASSPTNPLEELYRRPGFMIRRLHQIAVSLFLEETGALGVTNRQYGILFVLRHRPGIDQISVANLLGLDRSTTGMVLKKLEEDGLVVRSVEAHDRRRHSLELTRSGKTLLAQLAGPARRAQERLLAAFTPRERLLFLALLGKLTGEFNSSTRVPLDPHRPHRKAGLGGRREGGTDGTPQRGRL
jgi:MarR family transcriptional regulator, lower aerobic nicotinate degradation pathway regulator